MAEAVEELVEGHVELDVDGLAGPAGQGAGGGEAAAGFFQRVVAALAGGADVLGSGSLAQGVQDGGQRGGAPGGQGAGQHAGAAQGGG